MVIVIGNVIVIENDGYFYLEMIKVGVKLVVVDFMVVWWVNKIFFEVLL